MADHTDVIVKVLMTLEYLKLCGNHENPVGAGVPVDIVVMPDFVVDVDGAAITKLNNLEQPKSVGRLAPAEVGSRAGRVLSILAHLRDMDDECFQLHYIAKTGLAGKAILKERLGNHLMRCKLEPLRFPLITPALRTRYTALGRDQYVTVEKKQRQILHSKQDDILTLDELTRHFYSPLKKIKNARALFFATDSFAQFKALIDTAIIGEPVNELSKTLKNRGKAEDRHLIIDLAALHADEQKGKDRLIETMELLKRNENSGWGPASVTIAVHNCAKDIKVQDLFKIFRLRHSTDAILIYNNADIRWFHKNEESRVNGIELDPKRPDTREAFVAGILLHKAVGSAWRSVPKNLKHELDRKDNWTMELFPDPFEPRRGAFGHMKEAIDLGVVLANLWHKRPSDEVPDRRALVKCTGNEDCQYNDSDNTQLTELAEDNPLSWYMKLCGLDKNWFDAKRTSDELKGLTSHLHKQINRDGLHVHPKGWGKSTESSVIDITSEEVVRALIAHQTLHRMALHDVRCELLMESDVNSDGRNFAYLMDLDGNLVYSKGFRKTCIRRAILAMLEYSSDIKGCIGFPLMQPITRQLAQAKSQSSKKEELISVNVFLDRCYELYNLSIYKMWELWVTVFEAYPYYGYGETPKNFRQVWNHPFSYSVFHWVIAQLLKKTSQEFAIDTQDNLPMFAFVNATRDGIYESLIEDLKATIKLFKETRKENEKEDKKNIIDILLQKFSEDPRANWLLNETKDIHRGVYSFDLQHARYYETAVNNYWNVHYKPFRQIREVLRTLRDVLGVKLYVATEGHHDTQVRKINSLGLNEFFPEPVILSTEAAARQRDERLKDIQELEDNAQKAIDVFNAHFKDLELPYRREIDDWTGKYRQHIKHLRNLYQNQWEEFLNKNAGAIYTLIVASIIVNSENPFYEMTRLDELERQLSSNTSIEKKSMYFAMIGDREKKDISPLLNNFRKTKDAQDCVCAIRHFTLDHMNENIYWAPTTDAEKEQALIESEEEQEQERAPAHYVVWTHHQAVLFLANHKNWNNPVQYAILPPIIPGRLAKPDGKILDEILDAMYFGSRTAKNMKNGGFAFTLINYLVVQATVRDGDIDTLRLMDNIIERMHEKRNVNEEYKFLWDRIHRIWYFSREMESEKEPVGERIFKMIYQELLNNPNIADLQEWALNLLGEIQGSFFKPENINNELIQMFNNIENLFNNRFHRIQVSAIINDWN